MSSPNQAMNDFLTDSNNNNNNINRSNTNKNDSRDDVPINSNNGATRNDDYDYDYEMQDYRTPAQINRSNTTTSNRPTTNYIIPQYSMNMGQGMNSFPIQEVVPSSQMAISTGIETHHHHHFTDNNNNNPGDNSNTRILRPRGQTTVSTNIHNVNEFYNNNNNNPDNTSAIHSTSQSQSQQQRQERNSNTGHTSPTQLQQQQYNDPFPLYHDMNNNNEDEEPNVPMMVKPKTLYQNPQTPTVLPSTYHPINKWSAMKQSYLKEFLAEFLGTMVMILFGTAVCVQVNVSGKLQQNNFNDALYKLSSNNTINANTVETFQTLQNLVSSVSGGTFDDIPLGWGAAVVMGYFSAGGSAISGAHLNPSITLANLMYRGFPIKKLPYYIGGQMLGGFAGALILFIYYKKVLMYAYDDWWMNESVINMFVTVPKPFLSTARQFTSEFITTAALQAGIFALTDPYTCLSSDVFPLMLFILIFILNASMGVQTGCAINMARDLGPRLALYACGFDRKLLWESHHHYFWIPMVAPFVGALCGGLIYDVCIYQGHESPVNWPLALYKEYFLNIWFRRPGWKKRNRARATSDLSDFSYNNDDDEDEEEGNTTNDYESNGLNDSDSIMKNAEFTEETKRPKNDVSGKSILKGSKMKKTKSKISTKESNSISTDTNNHVQFRSVQRNGSRGYGGIPTILEEEDSIETASLGSSENQSLNFSEGSSGPFIDHNLSNNS
ncbi:MIP/aquaporin family protein NDAI_0H00230 [Naumovozyma dairenensis CBS 421]|uniref:Uncharacterized protein n=1 Tax=Naumovozyma dairenensis (strain ATCC 10597 / BCRC 20456 / CBS 421 / NBRC 0211 / NRRL Y-12639) TaxID=1071378 RepID=G0WEI6_NAUDC|nr:hypothetical protein NDAI_0H00230 [Naumovozyma dairenensis CBS 421]CCD26197.1 hypothetical protein NDAI_0H00230 [Naumovozyma dairenensis CBS 421]